MKHLISLLFAVAIFFAVAAAEPQEDSTVEKTIVQLCTDWDNAYIKKDLKELQRILGDDYIGIDGEGNVTGKQAELEMTRSGDFSLLSVHREEPLKVRVYGEAAIVTGYSTVAQKYKGEEIKLRVRFTIACVKRGSGWQIVTWQGGVAK